ncbi:MAG: sulfur carrier protein ThiS [bacterium]
MKMSIFINGKKEELGAAMRISDLLKKKKIRPEVVTVELNNTIIKREEYSRTMLKDQDRVEFVYFMGGG